MFPSIENLKYCWDLPHSGDIIANICKLHYYFNTFIEAIYVILSYSYLIPSESFTEYNSLLKTWVFKTLFDTNFSPFNLRVLWPIIIWGGGVLLSLIYQYVLSKLTLKKWAHKKRKLQEPPTRNIPRLNV